MNARLAAATLVALTCIAISGANTYTMLYRTKPDVHPLSANIISFSAPKKTPSTQPTSGEILVVVGNNDLFGREFRKGAAISMITIALFVPKPNGIPTQIEHWNLTGVTIDSYEKKATGPTAVATIKFHWTGIADMSAHSTEFGHRFQFKSATHSKVIRPPIPAEFGHPRRAPAG